MRGPKPRDLPLVDAPVKIGNLEIYITDMNCVNGGPVLSGRRAVLTNGLYAPRPGPRFDLSVWSIPFRTRRGIQKASGIVRGEVWPENGDNRILKPPIQGAGNL